MNACQQQIPAISRRSPTPSPPRSRRGSTLSQSRRRRVPGSRSNRRHGPTLLARSHPYSSSNSSGSSSAESERDLGCSINSRSPYTAHMADKMRRNLRFFFMTPCDKYRARKRLPHKLWLQLLKIVMVTIQLIIFSSERAVYVGFLSRSQLTFRNLYCKNWDPSYETLPYPPATGTYALYEQRDLYHYIDYAMDRFNRTPSLAIGPFAFKNHPPPGQNSQRVTACVKHYKSTNIHADNLKIDSDPVTVEVCHDVDPVVNETDHEFYDFKQFLKDHNDSIILERLYSVTLKLELKYIRMPVPQPLLPEVANPDCHEILVKILFDNSKSNGQILILLDTDVDFVKCKGSKSHYTDGMTAKIALTIFDGAVIVVCAVSMLLCMRSIQKSYLLCKETMVFFKNHFQYALTISDKSEFLPFWFLLIICSDVLAIAGSGVKLAVSYEVVHEYDSCGMLLGLTNFCVWIGVLRYIGYFKKYNVLILTVKKSLPNMLRFLLCASTFYVAYALCGWTVLGPYHMKFSTLMTTSECLFSLVNGDDMYVTFSILDKPHIPSSIYIFSRFYLYSFISLFIYIVLSTFIAVIMDTYETIKHGYEHGTPQTMISKFIEEQDDDPWSDLYLSDMRSNGRERRCCLFPCCQKRTEDPDDTVNIVA